MLVVGDDWEEYANSNSNHSTVPPGVLQVLPGPGITTGMDLVSNPLIKKVDITVSFTDYRRNWSVNIT